MIEDEINDAKEEIVNRLVASLAYAAIEIGAADALGKILNAAAERYSAETTDDTFAEREILAAMRDRAAIIDAESRGDFSATFGE